MRHKREPIQIRFHRARGYDPLVDTMDQIQITKLRELIRDIPDFPKKGINFKDITPLLANPLAFKSTIDRLSSYYMGKKIDLVAGVEQAYSMSAFGRGHCRGESSRPGTDYGELLGLVGAGYCQF